MIMIVPILQRDEVRPAEINDLPEVVELQALPLHTPSERL